MTSRSDLTAARLALANAARGIVAGNLNAASNGTLTFADQSVMAPFAEAALALLGVRDSLTREQRLVAEAFDDARRNVRKSKLERLLNGAGDLWNGDDRARQFAMLNEAAATRRLICRLIFAEV